MQACDTYKNTYTHVYTHTWHTYMTTSHIHTRGTHTHIHTSTHESYTHTHIVIHTHPQESYTHTHVGHILIHTWDMHLFATWVLNTYTHIHTSQGKCCTSFIWDMSYLYETWLLHMRHDSFIWDLTHSYETWFIHMRQTWFIHIRHPSFIWDITHSNEKWRIHVRHDSFWVHTDIWKVQQCATTCACVCTYVCMCVCVSHTQRCERAKGGLVHMSIMGTATTLQLHCNNTAATLQQTALRTSCRLVCHEPDARVSDKVTEREVLRVARGGGRETQRETEGGIVM